MSRFDRGSTMKSLSIQLFLIFALAVFLAACTYRGQVEEPVTWKATWFSYVNGDDIRERCSNIRDHWEVRLIYNGNYDEQVRVYHLIEDGVGGANVTARASQANAGNLLDFSLQDPLAPWRWHTSEVNLSSEDRDALESRLAKSRVFQTAPSGLELKSWASYWVSIACRDGELFFNAWTYPSERWDQQKLREIVKPLDRTGVPFNDLRKPDVEVRFSRDRQRGKGGPQPFQLRVGENGLAGIATPF